MYGFYNEQVSASRRPTATRRARTSRTPAAAGRPRRRPRIRTSSCASCRRAGRPAPASSARGTARRSPSPRWAILAINRWRSAGARGQLPTTSRHSRTVRYLRGKWRWCTMGGMLRPGRRRHEESSESGQEGDERCLYNMTHEWVRIEGGSAIPASPTMPGPTPATSVSMWAARWEHLFGKGEVFGVVESVKGRVGPLHAPREESSGEPDLNVTQAHEPGSLR